jgi:hypothetical protein
MRCIVYPSYYPMNMIKELCNTLLKILCCKMFCTSFVLTSLVFPYAAPIKRNAPFPEYQYRSPPTMFPWQPLYRLRCSISRAFFYMSFKVPSRGAIPTGSLCTAPIDKCAVFRAFFYLALKKQVSVSVYNICLCHIRKDLYWLNRTGGEGTWFFSTNINCNKGECIYSNTFHRNKKMNSSNKDTVLNTVLNWMHLIYLEILCNLQDMPMSAHKMHIQKPN